MLILCSRDHRLDLEIEDESPALGGKRARSGGHNDQAAARFGAHADQVVRLVSCLDFYGWALVGTGRPDKPDSGFHVAKGFGHHPFGAMLGGIDTDVGRARRDRVFRPPSVNVELLVA